MDNYQKRFYRDYHKHTGLKSYQVSIKTSDLYIASSKISKDIALAALKKARKDIESAIQLYPEFLTSFTPLNINSPNKISQRMVCAAKLCNVGPMAAVAGAVSQYVGEMLLETNNEVIVENGGDVFISSKTPRKVLIYAGVSPVSMKMAIEIPAGTFGVCTSAAEVGPSVSLGKADAAVVISKDTALSDAAATLLGNMAKDEKSIESAVNYVASIPNIIGAIVIVNDKIAVKGNVKLTHP